MCGSQASQAILYNELFIGDVQLLIATPVRDFNGIHSCDKLLIPFQTNIGVIFKVKNRCPLSMCIVFTLIYQGGNPYYVTETCILTSYLTETCILTRATAWLLC